MVEFKIETKGVLEAIKAVEKTSPKQLPFILAVAITETARDVQFILKREMYADIDRPREFTINSMYSTNATKTKLQASVLWRDFGGKGTPGGKYLRPIAEGGSRDLKRSEVALKKQGLLPFGYYLVPGEDAKLDQYGNVPSTVYVQMLSALRAFNEVGYLANRTAKSQAKRQLTPWFVVLPGTKTRLAPGIYQRLKTKRKLIFAIVRNPHYKITFPFEGVSRRAALERMPIQFDKALALALKTAR